MHAGECGKLEQVHVVILVKPGGRGCRRGWGARSIDLHKVALEELLQPLLGCRVGQVSDVEAATLSRAGGRGIGRLLSNGSVGQSGGHVIDGGVSSVVLLGGRHFGWLIWDW